MEARFAHALRQSERQRRAAAHIPGDAEDDGRIAVADVPFSPLRVAVRRCFDELVSLVDGPVLGPPAAWAPAAVGNSIFDGEVEGSAVCSRLPAGDNRNSPPCSNPSGTPSGNSSVMTRS